MLKAEVNDKTTTLTLVGNLSQICTDLSYLLRAVSMNIDERDKTLGELFWAMFTRGFMDGLCFDVTSEQMEQYLGEKKSSKKTVESMDFLRKLIKLLEEEEDDSE